MARWVKKLLKKQRKIQLKLEKSWNKYRSIQGGIKVRESICISILDDSIFVKIQTINRYSKGVKGNVAIKGRIVCSRLNYFKVKITEGSRTEWDKIAWETVWRIDKKALKRSNS